MVPWAQIAVAWHINQQIYWDFGSRENKLKLFSCGYVKAQSGLFTSPVDRIPNDGDQPLLAQERICYPDGVTPREHIRLRLEFLGAHPGSLPASAW
jgi:hypothetical protein